MNIAAPPPRENMGEPLPRIAGRLKVTGAATYPADIVVNNLAYAVLVPSTIARGRVKRVYTDAATRVRGVLDVLTIGDLEGKVEKPKFGNAGSTSIGPLQDNRIWHDGQVIAVTVAETFEAAREAAVLVRADYEEEKPSATFDSAGTEEIDAKG